MGTVFSGVLHSQVRKLNLDLPDSLQKLVLENIDAVLALPENLRRPLINAYITAVRRSFIIGIVISILGGLSAVIMERKKISVQPPSQSTEKPIIEQVRKQTSTYFDDTYQSC